MVDPISGDAIRKAGQVGADMAKAQEAPLKKGETKFDSVMNDVQKEMAATKNILQNDLTAQVNQVSDAQKTELRNEWVNRVSRMEHTDQVDYFARKIDSPSEAFLQIEKNLPNIEEGPWKDKLMERLDEFQAEQGKLKGWLDDFTSGKEFSQQELLAIQIRAHQIGESTTILTKVVEHSVSGMKTIFQTNI